MSKAEPVYHPMRPRVRSNKRARRRMLRSFFKFAITAALLCAALYAVQSYFANSQRFSLQEVIMPPMKVLTKDDVLRAAGLNTGLNTILLDRKTIEKKVLSIPYVQSCSVRREFPNRLFIDITERKPSAIFLYDSHAFEMDKEGRLLRELDPLMPLYLPLISSDEVKALPAPGETLDLPGVMAAIQLVDVYYATSLKNRFKLSEIAVKNPSTILMFADGVPYEMRWGRGDFFAQAQRLETLLDTHGAKLPCTEYLDLRFGPDLVCK